MDRYRRSLVLSATAVTALGLITVITGITQRAPARSAGGTCFAMAGLAVLALVYIRGWLHDTSSERQRLQDATTAAHDERSKYLTATAVLGAERERMQRDADATTQRAAAQLAAEREAMRDDFDAERTALVLNAFETGARLSHGGWLAPTRETLGQLLMFRERERHPVDQEREHGVVHP